MTGIVFVKEKSTDYYIQLNGSFLLWQMDAYFRFVPDITQGPF